ncbi:hypothetical protein GH714_009335 [Hevea brasiliensis]|uniref:Peptidase A2 domain-containing protein n=1 Tax=Hevea brasiliensis TaxID=3981 RepID=A0A6A6LFD2_HEVBR|nr:hypothetical protein GH714_009335 [Hevea brasiliensis]
MGALRILGALEKQKPIATTERGLMYVDLLINEKNARALVDTGATDNFIVDTLVTRFKLTVQADAGKIKAVNSQALNIVGFARGCPVKWDLGKECLAEFDFLFEYKPGSSNRVADALSRKSNLATLSRSQVDTSLRRQIQDSLKKDPQAVALMKLEEEGKTKQF